MFISSFAVYILFCNLSSTLGTNLDIIEDKNYQIEDKYCQREDKIVKEEIKRVKVRPPDMHPKIVGKKHIFSINISAKPFFR